MKHLLTLVLFAFGLNAIAQFPNLPYNPDENGDGLIGVVDLQGLLANYGNEFASAVVSEDGESAIVYMGEMKYPHCEYACEQLPGYWSMPELKDLVPVWGDVYNVDHPNTWLKPQENMLGLTGDKERLFPYFIGASASSGKGVYVSSNGFDNDKRCYCTAKQLPRVEWNILNAAVWAPQDADSWTIIFNEMAQDGWSLHPDFSILDDNKAAFWRWAE